MTAVYVYVFGVGKHHAKVGLTDNLGRRGYHLCWGNLPSYVTWPVHTGEYIAVVMCRDASTAKRLERTCQNRLGHCRHPGSPARGGRYEWFDIDPANAAEILLEAGEEFGAETVHRNADYIGAL